MDYIEYYNQYCLFIKNEDIRSLKTLFSTYDCKKFNSNENLINIPRVIINSNLNQENILFLLKNHISDYSKADIEICVNELIKLKEENLLICLLPMLDIESKELFFIFKSCIRFNMQSLFNFILINKMVDPMFGMGQIFKYLGEFDNNNKFLSILMKFEEFDITFFVHNFFYRSVILKNKEAVSYCINYYKENNQFISKIRGGTMLNVAILAGSKACFELIFEKIKDELSLEDNLQEDIIYNFNTIYNCKEINSPESLFLLSHVVEENLLFDDNLVEFAKLAFAKKNREMLKLARNKGMVNKSIVFNNLLSLIMCKEDSFTLFYYNLYKNLVISDDKFLKKLIGALITNGNVKLFKSIMVEINFNVNDVNEFSLEYEGVLIDLIINNKLDMLFFLQKRILKNFDFSFKNNSLIKIALSVGEVDIILFLLRMEPVLKKLTINNIKDAGMEENLYEQVIFHYKTLITVEYF